MRAISLLVAGLAVCANAFTGFINNFGLFAHSGSLPFAVLCGYLATLLILVALLIQWWRPAGAHWAFVAATVAATSAFAAGVPTHLELAARNARSPLVQLAPFAGAALLTALAAYLFAQAIAGKRR